MRRAVIVDLSWCLHRFAYVHQNLKVVRQGQAIFTGTIYGMALLGQSLWRPENKIIFAMDDKDKERAEIVPSYKANRPKNKEVYDLMHPIVSVLSLLPKVSFDYAEGKEADDIIAQRAFELKGEG